MENLEERTEPENERGDSSDGEKSEPNPAEDKYFLNENVDDENALNSLLLDVSQRSHWKILISYIAAAEDTYYSFCLKEVGTEIWLNTCPERAWMTYSGPLRHILDT